LVHLKNLKKFTPEFGGEKEQDMAFIAPKGLALPKDYMVIRISYVQK
jgi:hypothetical protein